MPAQRSVQRTRQSSKRAPKTKSPALKAKSKLTTKRFSATLFAFIMLGALVGGYFLIKSRAESNCVNLDQNVCAGFQATAPGADKATDGYNADISLAYFMPNFSVGGVAPYDSAPCDAAYRYVGVNNRMTYTSYENALKSNFGTSHLMSVGQYTRLKFTNATNYQTEYNAYSPAASKNVGAKCSIMADSDDYVHAVVRIKNTGDKAWQSSDVAVPHLGVDATGVEVQRWFAADIGRTDITGSDASSQGAYRGDVPTYPTVGITGAGRISDSPPARVKDTSNGVPCGGKNRDGTTNCVVNPGETVWVDIQVPNYSKTSWTYHTDCVWAPNRCPSGGVTGPGRYQIPLQMVIDGKYWFGNKLVVDFEARDDLVDVNATVQYLSSNNLKYDGPHTWNADSSSNSAGSTTPTSPPARPMPSYNAPFGPK